MRIILRWTSPSVARMAAAAGAADTADEDEEAADMEAEDTEAADTAAEEVDMEVVAAAVALAVKTVNSPFFFSKNNLFTF